MRTLFRNVPLCCLLLAPLLPGCSPPEDRLVQQSRERFLSPQLPEGIVSLASAVQSSREGETVSVAGSIYGGNLSPFDPQESSFMMIELPEPGHKHDDPNDCPFCKRKAENAASVIVELCDPQGVPLKMPADKLLQLTLNQNVAVSGTCYRVGEVLIIRATRVHLLDAATSDRLAASFTNQSAL